MITRSIVPSLDGAFDKTFDKDGVLQLKDTVLEIEITGKGKEHWTAEKEDIGDFENLNWMNSYKLSND